MKPYNGEPIDPSDEATGLPPLGDIDIANAMIVLAWTVSEGIVALGDDTVAAHMMHLRGLNQIGDEIDWVQVHVAIPHSVLELFLRNVRDGHL